MAYFLPSFFQKRVLRYALSRLELVDTENLDLDSLGIRWGQRSTVELRDISLKLEVNFFLFFFFFFFCLYKNVPLKNAIF